MASQGDGYDDSEDSIESNVVPLEAPKKKKSVWSEKKDKPEPPPSNDEPIINLPPYTKFILFALLGIHLVVTYLLSEEQTHWVYIHLGFIPGRFTGAALFEPLAILTPFTHMLLHGGWLHMAMNGVMLLAFGSGIEKWIGGKKMIAFFVATGLIGVLAHFGLNWDSYQPVVGASGGLSGLFALALIMLRRRNMGMAGKYGFLPIIILWVGISILFGMMGSPDGGQIAWAAHVGGFLGGFLVAKWIKL